MFESLPGLDGSGHSGTTAWSISSWARGELLDAVEYKAELVGIEVETVNPWGTSRYCPRCGERGHTVKAPNDNTELRSGRHFQCPHCEYECDRDVVGAVNVGRKHLGDVRMERSNPADYTSAGNHASFPSHVKCDRSEASLGLETGETSGVQSTADHPVVVNRIRRAVVRPNYPRPYPAAHHDAGWDTAGWTASKSW